MREDCQFPHPPPPGSQGQVTVPSSRVASQAHSDLQWPRAQNHHKRVLTEVTLRTRPSLLSGRCLSFAFVLKRAPVCVFPSGLVRCQAQRRLPLKDLHLFLTVSKRRACHPTQGHARKHLGWSGAGGLREGIGRSLY